MKRKIIKQANQAYTITLPINWIRENNFDNSTELDMEIMGKTITINSGINQTNTNLEIDMNEVEKKEIYRHILAAYTKGIDELTIKSTEDISKTIIKCTNSLIGYALITHEDDKFIVKDISPGSYSNLDEIFKRVFQMIILFYEAAIKDIFGKENETSESLRARDNEVNKFCLYLERAINKTSYAKHIQGRTLFTYSFELEKIGDEIERLWRTNIIKKIKKTNEINLPTEQSSGVSTEQVQS